MIVDVLFSCAPQTLAAAWNALRRCWPSVVPGLPPTGAAGVGSLNPTPAALPFWITIVAAPKLDALNETSISAAQLVSHARRQCSVRMFHLPRGCLCALVFPGDQTLIRLAHDLVEHLVVAEDHADGIVGAVQNLSRIRRRRFFGGRCRCPTLRAESRLGFGFRRELCCFICSDGTQLARLGVDRGTHAFRFRRALCCRLLRDRCVLDTHVGESHQLCQRRYCETRRGDESHYPSTATHVRHRCLPGNERKRKRRKRQVRSAAPEAAYEREPEESAHEQGQGCGLGQIAAVHDERVDADVIAVHVRVEDVVAKRQAPDRAGGEEA